MAGASEIAWREAAAARDFGAEAIFSPQTRRAEMRYTEKISPKPSYRYTDPFDGNLEKNLRVGRK